MKKTLNLQLLFVCLLTAIAPLGATATTFFSDTFSSGSTLNQPPVAPTTTSASYQSYIGTAGGLATINPGHLLLTNNSSSVIQEFVALFSPTNTPVVLSATGDQIVLTVVFVNSNNILGAANNANSSLSIGLFNSGLNIPNQGNLITSTGNLTGGSQNWFGYIGRMFHSGNNSILTRPTQTPNGSTSQNQDALFSGASSTQTFNNPAGAAVGSTTANPGVTLTNGSTYTVQLAITVTGTSTLGITNTLYNGSGTNGGVLYTQGRTASGATFLTSGFDSLAIGWRNTAAAAQDNAMDITSILITGVSTPVSGPPTITAQPVPVVVATNGAAAFSVTANGFNMNFQWHRNNTVLTDGGHISGSTTPQLVITPSTTADAFSGTSGYWVTVGGTGGFTTNSVTNSLALIIATNLLWSGTAANWDVNSTVAWLDTNGNPSVFNYGDSVTLDSSAGATHTVNLVGNFLSASSVTVDSTFKYIIQSSGNNGSIAGPGGLLLKNSGQLEIKNANTYSGGTIISNSAASLFLDNYGGLGNGPVTFAKAGGSMDITVPGSASSGINGDVIVADDFTINFDSAGTFSGVFFGNLSGTVGKTLTFEETSVPFTNSRVRIYGTNTVYNGNLFIDGPATSQAQYSGVVMAAYGSSGTQTFNGIISGNGGFMSRGNGTTIFSNANTFAGGTTPTSGSIGFGIDSTPTVGTVTAGPIGTGPLNLAPEIPNLTGSGTVFAFGGDRTIANTVQYPSGSNDVTLIITGGTNNLTFSGPYNLNGVDGLVGATTNRTISVGNTNGVTTISGVISDGGFVYGFIKIGVGKLILSNTETYTGPTMINGGTLVVNGALNAASAVTATNGVLGGWGTVNGPVTIQKGAGIAPGNSIGTLTINNNLTIQAGSTNNFEVNKTAGTKDLVNVSGNITYAGTLSATNLSGTITTNDSFKIFNVTGTKTGTFTSIIGSPGPGLAWSFTNSTGVLGVISGFNPGPGTNITATLIGGTNLSLSWPDVGWRLQVQTNSLATGLSNNWSDVPNSTSVNSTNFIINRANGSVYYRLMFP